MTKIASIRNLQRLGLLRPNEAKRVAADFHVTESLGDCRHVAGSARTAGAAGGVMRVLLEAGSVRPILSVGAVAGQAHCISRLTQHRLVVRAVWIVATETRDAARIHQALNEIVALHAVLVGRAVGEMREARFAELVLFEPPKIRKVQSDMKADWPIIVFPFYGIGQRAALRVALDADIVGMHVVEARGIEDVDSSRLGNMSASGAMTLLAADIPFADSLGRDIVVH